MTALLEWRNGRRKGLKIPRPQKRTGSSPVSSTKNTRTVDGEHQLFLFLRCYDSFVLKDSSFSSSSIDGSVPLKFSGTSFDNSKDETPIG